MTSAKIDDVEGAAADTASTSTSSSAIEKPHRSKPQSGRSGQIKPTKWSAREVQRHKMEAIKAREREMKEGKVASETTRREVRQERKRKKEEKERLEMMGAKMSAKKLDRKKRRLGLTKKVAH